MDPTCRGCRRRSYDLPMMAGTLHSPTLAVRPLWWRSVGHTHTAYVMETMIDELAAAAGRDPVASASPCSVASRAAAVLKLAADKAGGASHGAPASRRHRGARVVRFLCRAGGGSVDAQRKIKVERVVCAVDCGMAVNPDVIRAQMEGCIGFGSSALYYSEVEIKAGRAVQRNFDTYRSLRIHEMPEVEVHIVPSPEKPTGVGEPGVPPLGTRGRERDRQAWGATRTAPAVFTFGPGWWRPDATIGAVKRSSAQTCRHVDCHPRRPCKTTPSKSVRCS